MASWPSPSAKLCVFSIRGNPLPRTGTIRASLRPVSYGSLAAPTALFTVNCSSRGRGDVRRIRAQPQSRLGAPRTFVFIRSG
jgi:hypothetical protein